MSNAGKSASAAQVSVANPKVQFYFEKESPWQPHIRALRAIALACPLAEELKWGVPSYTHEGGLVVLIHVFKEYCALLFPKGVLLKDPKRILVIQTPNVQAARQIRFSTIEDVEKNKAVLKAYIREAIELEKSGAKVQMKTVAEFPMADEFKARLEKHAALKKAFGALTPGRQRNYLLYFSSAKQARTREARIDKCAPLILKGKGLDD